MAQNFYYLILEKATIGLYKPLPDFSKFFFRTDKDTTGNLYLEGIAIDIHENKMGNVFSLVTVNMPPESLRSHFRGAFVVTLDEMNNTLIDWSRDVYFSPKQYKGEDHTFKNFVGYILGNSINEFAAFPLFPNTLSLNPSPPHNR